MQNLFSKAFKVVLRSTKDNSSVVLRLRSGLIACVDMIGRQKQLSSSSPSSFLTHNTTLYATTLASLVK